MFRKTLLKKIAVVAENQRVLVFKNQELNSVLTPGKHKIWDIKNELEFVTFDINTLYFSEQNAERLYRNHKELSDHISHWKLDSTEVGMLYVNDLLRGVVAPSEHLYLWKDTGEIRLEKISIKENITVEEDALLSIKRAGANNASRLIKSERTKAVLPIKECTVEKDHVGLLFINGQLIEILGQGQHGFWQFHDDIEIKSYDTSKLYFSDKNVDTFYRKNKDFKSHISHWKLESTEVGLLYVNDLLRGIVAPSEHLYLWKDAGEIRLEKVSIDEDIAVDNKSLFLINRAGANASTRLIKSERTVAIKPIADLNVAKDHIGLLYVNDQLVKRLTPGQHAFWQFNHTVELKTFDCRTQLLEISGQEILSKDRVSLRINLSASIKVNDAELAARSVDKVDDFVYKALQLALREAVGTKSLDDILLDKLYVNETVKELVVERLSDIGIALLSVGVKDIILPGEMKAILNQVVEAQKAAEANVIKRREETSATRSLHNTAKVMENNPTLMRLKELEALEKVSEKIGSLTVYGGLEGLMNGVVKIA